MKNSFLEGFVYFTIYSTSSAGTILPFQLYPALSTYNVYLVTLTSNTI